MMPMPNREPMGGPVAPGGQQPSPMEGGGPGEGGPEPEAIKAQLVTLLRKAKQVAEQNGVEWNSVVSAVDGKNIKSDVPLPRQTPAGPPSPAGARPY